MKLEYNTAKKLRWIPYVGIIPCMIVEIMDEDEAKENKVLWLKLFAFRATHIAIIVMSLFYIFKWSVTS